MKYLLILMSLHSFILHAETNAVSSSQVNQMVSYLRNSPARVYGDVTLGDTVNLSEGIPRVRMNRGFPLGFDITERSFSVNARAGEPGALTLQFKVGLVSVPIKINSISYSDSGSFEVDVNTPMGLGDGLLESAIKNELKNKFESKMRAAFMRLRSLRQQRTIQDAQNIMSVIGEIFSDEAKAGPSPLDRTTITGNINLEITPRENETMEVGTLAMDIIQGDAISAGVGFTKRGTNVQVETINLNSRRGITFRPQNESRTSVVSARVTGIRIDSQGLTPTYITGAEGAFAVISTILAYQGSAGLGVAPGCDPAMRIDAVQGWLNCRLNGELAKIVRDNRQMMLDSGINPSIIRTLMETPSSQDNCNLD